MGCHVAVLTEVAGFDVSMRQSKPHAPGIEVVTMQRADSKTREGVAYTFDEGMFTAEQAQSWLSEHGIKALRVEAAAVPRTCDMSNVEIAKAGVWPGTPKPIEISEADLAAWAENSNRMLAAGDAFPSKLGHDKDQSAAKKLFPEGGEPALGWLHNLRASGGSLLCDIKSVPVRFKEAVEAGLWGPRSAEIRVPKENGVALKERGWISGLAWLGAKRAAIPTLQAYGLAAGEEAEVLLAEAVGVVGDGGEGVPRAERAEDNAAPAGAGAGRTIETEEEISMEEVEALKAQMAAMRSMLVKGRISPLVGKKMSPAEAAKCEEFALSETDPGRLEVYLSQLEARPDIKSGEAASTEGGKASEKTGEALVVELAETLLAEGHAKDYEEALIKATSVGVGREQWDAHRTGLPRMMSSTPLKGGR